MIAASFLALAAYVGVEAIHGPGRREAPMLTRHCVERGRRVDRIERRPTVGVRRLRRSIAP